MAGINHSISPIDQDYVKLLALEQPTNADKELMLKYGQEDTAKRVRAEMLQKSGSEHPNYRIESARTSI